MAKMTEKQRQENLVVAKKMSHIEKECDNWWFMGVGKQLNNCSAKVYNTQKYYVLRSYATIIAAIEKSTGICYDWLRLVYGYTATSAQHINKFVAQYGNGTIKRWKER